MTAVFVRAALPSVRLGLAAMLREAGHDGVPADDPAASTAVQVLDQPDQAALDALLARRYSEQPAALVVLTDDRTMPSILARGGLRGWACLTRDATTEDLDLAVRAAEGGLVLLDLPTASLAIGEPPAVGSHPAGFEPLTPREVQVLQRLAEGLPNKGIARVLGISENTAKFHVASVCAKLGASSRTEAVTLAARQGLLVL